MRQIVNGPEVFFVLWIWEKLDINAGRRNYFCHHIITVCHYDSVLVWLYVQAFSIYDFYFCQFISLMYIQSVYVPCEVLSLLFLSSLEITAEKQNMKGSRDPSWTHLRVDGGAPLPPAEAMSTLMCISFKHASFFFLFELQSVFHLTGWFVFTLDVSFISPVQCFSHILNHAPVNYWMFKNV